tara:strand:- start:48 stop:365 length:318 start_codon:yes stop_codon:yes gene_type:complete
MNRTPIAIYKSNNSTYFEYSDGWTCQNNGDEIPLEHAAYIHKDNYKNIIKGFCKKLSKSELEELITDNQSLDAPAPGGIIVSIVVKDNGKIGIRNSGEIKEVTSK